MKKYKKHKIGNNAIIYEGDVLDCLKELPDNSIHCVITSPPYWSLRDYKCGKWKGGDPNCDHVANPKVTKKMGNPEFKSPCREATTTKGYYKDICPKCGAKRITKMIGLEPTFDEWLSRMVEVCNEIKRVLRHDGTFWLNMGDTYASSGSGAGQSNFETSDGRPYDSFRSAKYLNQKNPKTTGGIFKAKDLLLMPSRLAIALHSEGWWIRKKIIWYKKNPVPESVTDRPTSSHEEIYLLTKSEYEEVFLLTKRARYFYDNEAVKENQKGSSLERQQRGVSNSHKYLDGPDGQGKQTMSQPRIKDKTRGVALLRNLRDVWEMAIEPNTWAMCPKCKEWYGYRPAKCIKCGYSGKKWGGHFASFPKELPHKCILAGTSEMGCCSECGSPYIRIIDIDDHAGVLGKGFHDHKHDLEMGSSQKKSIRPEDTPIKTTIGWKPSCSCNTGNSVPCTVLDPFAGSCTTGEVALSLGRNFIGIELSSDYVQLGIKRIGKEEMQMKLFL